MSKKSFVLVVFIFFLSSFVLGSAQAAWPILHDNDLEKFIRTFPVMYREYKELGLHINPQTGNLSGENKLKRDKEVQRILKENDWNFMFWPKLQTITRGYSVLKYDQLKGQHGKNIEKFIHDLKNSKWMTPEKKAELEASFAKAKKDLSTEANRRRNLVHKKDIRIIGKYIPQLDIVLKEIIRVPR